MFARLVRRAAIAAALFAASFPAFGQQLPTVPSGTVIGRTAIGTGPAQAIPIQQLFNSLLTGPLSVPGVNTNSVIYKGSSSGQATVSAQAVAGTTTLLLPNTSGTLASNATSPIVLNATTGNISCPSCLSVANATPVLTSRAFALTQNLSSIAAIRTLGYSSGGDGGGAVFKNIGTAPFIDSFITGFTITGGSGYTNGGPYYGVLFQTGTKPYVVGTVNVSGGAITAVNISGTPGNQCAVGDVYAIVGSAAATAFPANGLPAGGTGAALTVTSCSTPLASFTDSVGTRFQFVPDAFPTLLQFGGRGDWNGTDASATDNFSAIQASLWFASFKSSTSFDGGGFWGGRVIAPQGSYLVCGTGLKSLIVPNDVVLEGPSAAAAATLRACDAYNASVHFVELCDPVWHFACFNSSLRNLSLSISRSVSSSIGIAMVHSNATQDFGGLSRVYIYSGERECTFFEKGFGGASSVVLEYVSCNISSSSGNPAMVFGNTVASGLNYGTTIIKLNTIVIAGPSSAPLMTGSGLLLKGGFYDIQNLHCEAVPTCAFVQIPSATGNGDIVRMHNVNGGGGGAVTCTGLITLDSANNPGNLIVGQAPAGSCAHVVLNGQPSGSNRDAAITTDVTFNP